jgi:diguanylate cyclase (GGDEF)-like protein/PAS domain S-box-containing protein
MQSRIARLEARLRESRRRHRHFEAMCDTLTRVLEATSDAFVALDANWRYIYVNEHAGRIFGRAPASLIGKHIWTEFPEGVGQPFHRAYERAAAERVPQQIEAYYPPYDRWFENRIFPYADGLAIFFRDVTERKALEAQLTHQAFHDPLTGLANRLLFRDRLEHSLARLPRGEHMAVVLLDLDDFKTVNDSLGHAAGDELLARVADRLAHAARGSDTVARFGGDEFALVLEGLAHDDDVGVVLDRVRATLGQPIAIGTREVSVSASLGVALARGGEGADDLVRNADVAMYRAKAEGKGRFAIFAPEMHAAAVERLEIEADLRAGLARGEFRLVFQPLVELASGRIVGAEALVRWEHPRRGTVGPATFIPVAEQTGLIVPLGRWVLTEACREAQAWSAAAEARGADAPPVTVNISGRQFQEPALASHVAAALADSALVPHRLVLEITESVMLNDAEAALAKLREIKSLGIRLAIDDFGTGYSSLAYLQRFPIDLLKMDKSFTDGIGREAAESALARAIVGLGHTLGMGTVAEGIETEAQLARLREFGCDVGQGYLFANPLRPSAFVALLRRGYAAPRSR